MRNMRLPAFRIVLALATALLIGRAQAADLEVATATVDITAPTGYPMGGYGARKGVSTGVHDPLLAKALLIRSGGQQFGIVTYDLVGIASQRVAREAREVFGLSAVLQIASHTHSGPVPKNVKNPEHDPWYRGMEDKVLGALKAAQSRYEPAQFWGYTRFNLHRTQSPESERERDSRDVLAQQRSSSDSSGRSPSRHFPVYGRRWPCYRAIGELCLPRRGARSGQPPVQRGLAGLHVSPDRA